MRMKRCVRCARPGLNEWFRPEIWRRRWCAAVQDCVLYLSSDIASDIFRVLPYNWTKLHKTCGGTLTLKGLVTRIQNKRKLPNLTLYNASQIIEKVVLSTFQTNKVLHYIKFAWFVATWIEWGLCRPTSIVMTVFACNNGIALKTICFVSRGAKYQEITAAWTIGRIIVTHNPITKSLAGNKQR